MSKEIPTPLSLLHKIGKTDEYLGELSGIHLEQLDRGERVQLRARAIGHGAMALAERHTSKSGYSDTEGQFFTLISTLHPFLEAQISIDTASGAHNFRRNEHLPDIEMAIDFNNALSEIIDHNPRLTPEQLSQFLESTFITSYGNKDAALFAQASERRIVGMQHEVWFDQITSHIDGLSSRPSTKQEEMKTGVDRFITFNGALLPVDIKSNREKANSLNQMDIRHAWSDTYKMWSHCRHDDFKNSFRLPNSVAKLKAAEVKKELLSAATMPYRSAA